MTLVAVVATLILLAAGIYRHNHELRAPFDKRHWHRAGTNSLFVYLTLTPPRVAMACTMVESGALLGTSRVDMVGMLGQTNRVMRGGTKDSPFYEVCEWDVTNYGRYERYSSLFVGFDRNRIAQEAWVGEKWSPDNRLPLQVSRLREPR